MMILFLFLLLPLFLHCYTIDTPVKRRINLKFQYDEELKADYDYIYQRLQEKFDLVLCSSLHKKMLLWNRVEIVSGWPSSVYHLEGHSWGRNDIKALREAVDSIEIRPLNELDSEKTPSADELYAQLMVECKRLGLMKHYRNEIDWPIIAANNDGFYLTTTRFQKWTSQDRRKVLKVIEKLKCDSEEVGFSRSEFFDIQLKTETIKHQNLEDSNNFQNTRTPGIRIDPDHDYDDGNVEWFESSKSKSDSGSDSEISGSSEGRLLQKELLSSSLLEQKKEDLDYIRKRLQEKFAAALGTPMKGKMMLLWSQVEIVSGWPKSVYLSEPAYWSSHDIAAMRAAIDSVEIRAVEHAVLDLPCALTLHAQLMAECVRLGFIVRRNEIDWNRIVGHADFLLLTTTNYRRWNVQDRRQIQILIEKLKNIDVNTLKNVSTSSKKHVRLNRVQKCTGLTKMAGKPKSSRKRKAESYYDSEAVKAAKTNDGQLDYSSYPIETFDKDLPDFSPTVPVPTMTSEIINSFLADVYIESPSIEQIYDNLLDQNLDILGEFIDNYEMNLP